MAAGVTPLLACLTDREEAVLLLLSEGFSQREIGTRLGVSAWTVKAHRDNARRKLRASSTTHAVAILVRARASA